MPGDYTRLTFDPLKDRAMVLEQQGRVHLDADFNELATIIERRLRVETRDVVGPAVYPAVEPDSFKITGAASGFLIGRGRMYVDGLLAENHGDFKGQLEYEPVWDEPRHVGPTPFGAQPYVGTQTTSTIPTPALLYLDVWQRELTSVEDPSVLEPALGVDTTTRVQTAWRVGALTLDGVAPKCDGEWDKYQPWLDLIRPSAGRLSSRGVGPEDVTDPCAVAPIGGYRGLDNRLYRVEVHDGGGAGQATVKWSRDNGAVASRVTKITSPATQAVIAVERLGRDDVLRFHTNEWVELIDDVLEFDRKPGLMLRVIDTDAGDQTVTVAAPVASGAIDFGRNPRLRRWDQGDASTTPADPVKGTIALTTLPAIVDLENGVQVTLELADPTGTFHVGDWWVFAARPGDASVEQLDHAPPRGVRHHFARLAICTGGDTIDDCRTPWPGDCDCDDCACQACVTPESHQDGKGPFTLQDAVDLVKPTGGRICVAPGVYRLPTTLNIDGAIGLTLAGAGSRTILASKQPVAIAVTDSADVTLEAFTLLAGGAAGLVDFVELVKKRAAAGNADGLATKDLAAATSGGTGLEVAIALINTIGARVERCIVANRSGGDLHATVGIGFAGFSIRTRLVENVIAADAAIGGLVGGRSSAGPSHTNLTVGTKATAFGSETSGAPDAVVYAVAEGSKYLLAADLTILDNLLVPTRLGIDFGGALIGKNAVSTSISVLAAGTRVERNLVLGGREAGISVLGLSLPDTPQITAILDSIGDIGGQLGQALSTVGSIAITDNVVATRGFGIRAGGDALKISDNWVYGPNAANLHGEPTQSHVDGIAIAPLLYLGDPGDAQVSGNTIAGAGRHGVSLRPLTGAAEVSRNRVERSGIGGVAVTSTDDDLIASEIRVLDNVVVDCGTEVEPESGRLEGISVTLSRVVRVAGNQVQRFAPSVRESMTREAIRVSNCGIAHVDENQLTDLGPIEKFSGLLNGISVSTVQTLHVNGNTVKLGQATAGTALTIDDGEPPKTRFAQSSRRMLEFLIASAVTGPPGGIAPVGVGGGVTGGSPAGGGAGPIVAQPAFIPPLVTFVPPLEVSAGTEDDDVEQVPVDPPRDVTINGNSLSAPGREKEPVVTVTGPYSVIVSNNHCWATVEPEGNPTTAVVVSIDTAGPIVVSANHILGRKHLVRTVELHTGTNTAKRPKALSTVLGNVTSGPIRLNGAALPAPWAALNIMRMI